MISTEIGLLLFSYLLGSVPFSAWIAHWRTGKDIYEVGEGNVGARNVWHVVGPQWGILASLLDGTKGWFCYVVGARVLHVSLVVLLLAGIAVILGHQFPVFRGGRGGKGLSTMGGFLLGFAPLPTLTGVSVLGLVFLATHNFNPSMVAGAVAAICSPLIFHQPQAAVYALVFGLLAGFKKLWDRNHEAAVWASHPWQGTTAKPGFLAEETDDVASVHHHPHEG